MTRQNPPRDERSFVRQIRDILRRLQVLETAPQPPTPFADLVHNTTQSIATSTITAINFNNEVVDTHGGHDNAANPSRYTAPLTGVYLVAVQVPFQGNTTGKRELWLRRSDGVEYQTTSIWPGTAMDTFLSVSCPIPMTAGMYVEAVVWHNAGVALNVLNTVHGGQHMLVQYLAKL